MRNLKEEICARGDITNIIYFATGSALRNMKGVYVSTHRFDPPLISIRSAPWMRKYIENEIQENPTK